MSDAQARKPQEAIGVPSSLPPLSFKPVPKSQTGIPPMKSSSRQRGSAREPSQESYFLLRTSFPSSFPETGHQQAPGSSELPPLAAGWGFPLVEEVVWMRAWGGGQGSG